MSLHKVDRLILGISSQFVLHRPPCLFVTQCDAAIITDLLWSVYTIHIHTCWTEEEKWDGRKPIDEPLGSARPIRCDGPCCHGHVCVSMRFTLFYIVLHNFTVLHRFYIVLQLYWLEPTHSVRCSHRAAKPFPALRGSATQPTSERLAWRFLPVRELSIVLECFDSFFTLWLIQVLVMWKRYGFPCFGSAALPSTLGLRGLFKPMSFQAFHHTVVTRVKWCEDIKINQRTSTCQRNPNAVSCRFSRLFPLTGVKHAIWV